MVARKQKNQPGFAFGFLDEIPHRRSHLGEPMSVSKSDPAALRISSFDMGGVESAGDWGDDGGGLQLR